jgi:hypothetical protein
MWEYVVGLQLWLLGSTTTASRVFRTPYVCLFSCSDYQSRNEQQSFYLQLHGSFLQIRGRRWSCLEQLKGAHLALCHVPPSLRRYTAPLALLCVPRLRSWINRTCSCAQNHPSFRSVGSFLERLEVTSPPQSCFSR